MLIFGLWTVTRYEVDMQRLGLLLRVFGEI